MVYFSRFSAFPGLVYPGDEAGAAGLEPGSLQQALLDAALKRRSTTNAAGYNNSETALDARQCPNLGSTELGNFAHTWALASPYQSSVAVADHIWAGDGF